MIPIVLDIETVPAGDYIDFAAEYEEECTAVPPTPKPEIELKDVPNSGNIKNEDKQLEWRKKKLISLNVDRCTKYQAEIVKYEKEVQKHEKAFDKFMQADLKHWKDRSFNDKTCEIVCIGVKINENPVQSFYGVSENQMLKEFTEFLAGNVVNGFEDFIWVGSNILGGRVGYDMDVLNSKLYRIESPALDFLYQDPCFLPDGSKWKHKKVDWKASSDCGRPLVFDFQHHLPSTGSQFIDKNGDKRTGTSLDHTLRHYGLQGKEGFDGSMVYDAWCDGDIDTIVEYNKDECEQMHTLFKRVLKKQWWRNNK